MGLQEFKTEGEGKKICERCYSLQGKKGILAMGAGEVPHSTAPLKAAGPQHLVASHLCNKVPRDPILHPNNWALHSICAEKVSHEKEKAQLTLDNGFFKTLHTFVTL